MPKKKEEKVIEPIIKEIQTEFSSGALEELKDKVNEIIKIINE